MPRLLRSNPHTKHKAIKLRKSSTPAEAKLWSKIRNDQLGITFRRQHAIGNYITDFCATRKKLIIELDGPPFGRSTWSRQSTIMKEQNILKHAAIVFCDFGTMMS